MYKKTKYFWNNIFSKEISNLEEKDVKKQFPYEDLEKAIKWLAKKSDNILDFGCGSGVFLARSYYNGISKGLGIDISKDAVKLGNKLIEFNDIDNFKIIFGDVNKLKEIESDSFDAAILSNVIDNVLPEDSVLILNEIHRILKKDGKLFLKLNDYIKDEMILENNEIFEKKISEDFYLETSGLYLYNLSNSKVNSLLEPLFKIVKSFKIEFKEHKQFNRAWYLIKK